jgi:outer membrane protein OmpU
VNRFIIAGLGLACLSTTAAAQQGLNIYGSLDEGVTYISNVRGHSLVATQDGINKANALGFSGVEDLGGGKEAFFRLENGYSVDTGALGQGGLMFGKQAFVGLSDRNLGDVSLGRQYDFTYQMLRYLPCLQCGIHSVENADLDRVSGERLNNAVQYLSKEFGGLRFGAIYAFGSDTGNSSTNKGRAVSGLTQYSAGGFSAGAAYTDINGAPVYAGLTGAPSIFGHPLTPATALFVDKQRIVAAGAAWQWQALRVSALYTNSYLGYAGSNARDQVLHVGGEYHLTGNLLLSGKVSLDKLDRSHWVTLSGGLDYRFSKRTDVYLDLHAQHASGASGTVASIAMAGTSSTDGQFLSRIGVRHLF